MNAEERWRGLNAYLRGRLSREETARLEAMLLETPDLAEALIECAREEATLMDWARAGEQCLRIDEEDASSTHAGTSAVFRRRRLRRRAAWAGVAAALILIAGVVVVLMRGEPVRQARVIASLGQIDGAVRVVGASGEAQLVEPGAEFQSGDTIRTDGAASAAVLVAPDGTRLALGGGTALTFADEGRKSVVLHGGTLFASVAPQPAGKAMLLTTAHAKLQVLGTQFALRATTKATDVSVSEGSVQLTRLSDGQSVDITAGSRVVSNGGPELVLEKIPRTPDLWSEDFERGLPGGWVSGAFLADALPAGSKGGVQAVPVARPEGTLFQVVSTEEWAHGLFMAHDDSHLHLTFRVQNPGWLNIIISTRTQGDAPRFASNYLFGDFPGRSVKSGTWHTVTVPLAMFKRLSGGVATLKDEVPFQVIVGAPAPDRGLAIDRIWVTRGGPGELLMEPVRAGGME